MEGGWEFGAEDGDHEEEEEEEECVDVDPTEMVPW